MSVPTTGRNKEHEPPAMVTAFYLRQTKHLPCLICFLTIFLMPNSLYAEDPEEAKLWLDKMARAIREQAYDGIFTYMRGSDLDTVRVVHSNRDGTEFERLVHLNGKAREIIRTGDRVVCHHADEDAADLNHGVPLGPFSRAFNENISALQDSYQFNLQGRDRVADRETVRLDINPKHTDRYGYRLWLDDQTGLLLQSRLVYQGRVLEVFQFSRVEIGGQIEPRELVSSIKDQSIEHELTLEVAREDSVNEDWRVKWVPVGFKRSIIRQKGVNGVLFTDGIATFTVIVEKRANSQLPNLATRMGGTVVISRSLRGSGQQITVVGELPIKTARRVAESVEPVIY